MYPISLRKLFALDFVSEIASLQSIFAIPAIHSDWRLGAGLGSGMSRKGSDRGAARRGCRNGRLEMAVNFSWLRSCVVGVREANIVALIGVMAGLGGALAVNWRHLSSNMLNHSGPCDGLRRAPLRWR